MTDLGRVAHITREVYKAYGMEIALTSEQLDFVRLAVEEGRFQNPDQARQEAMALWIERERRRAELLRSLDAAETSLARGEGLPITGDTMTNLARERYTETGSGGPAAPDPSPS